MHKYENGKRYRVIKDGAHLWGWQPDGPWSSRGWSKQLAVGEIITCLGESWTRGDGVPALKWGDESGKWICDDYLFRPVQGGMWGGQVPEDGYLEEARDE